MAKTNIAGLVVLLVVPAILTALPTKALAMEKDVQDAIAAYSAKDYANAVALLEKSNQKDPLVRYYLGLSYQGLGDFKEAESEYRWGYTHGTNKDLQYKSWQGLQGILTMNKNRRTVVAGYIPKAAAVAESKPLTDAENMQNFRKKKKVDLKIDYTPGCPRHY